MINTDRGPGARRQYLHNVQAQVVRHGWVVQAVPDAKPMFAYTVGLTRHGHPELVFPDPPRHLQATLGGDPQQRIDAMAEILNQLAALAIDNKLTPGREYDTSRGPFTVNADPLPPGADPKVANALYGRRAAVPTLTVRKHTPEKPRRSTSRHKPEKGHHDMADTTPVQGIPRDDPFLAETDEGMALRDALITATMQAHDDVHQRRDWAGMGRFQKIRVGDLVLELTRASWSKDPHTRKIGFGYLVARRGEHTYIQYGPNPDDVCDWENAMFIRAESTLDPQVSAEVLRRPVPALRNPFLCNWNTAVAHALADWLDRTATQFTEMVKEDTPDCPNCGTGYCAGHPPALYCDRCGNPVESTDYPEDPCRCWAEALATARALTVSFGLEPAQPELVAAENEGADRP